MSVIIIKKQGYVKFSKVCEILDILARNIEFILVVGYEDSWDNEIPTSS